MMLRAYMKSMQRAYDVEADDCVRTTRPQRLDSPLDRLKKARETVAKFGRTTSIRVSESYHHARVKELELTGDGVARLLADLEPDHPTGCACSCSSLACGPMTDGNTALLVIDVQQGNTAEGWDRDGVIGRIRGVLSGEQVDSPARLEFRGPDERSRR
jgi:hypothetical protein